MEGIYSYFEAVRELRSQINEIDALFVACGTGTTLTGISAGMQEYFPDAIVHGISVARTLDAELPVLQEDMKILNDYLGTDYGFSNMCFHEEFLAGGYAKATELELGTIKECISKEGLVIDPTYVGKAFHGMVSLLSKEEYKGQKILFWNTGGLINVLSQRHLFNI